MLSPRQQELELLLYSKLSLKEIANQLGWSDPFTKRTAQWIYEKKGVSSRLELVIDFYRNLVEKGMLSSDTIILKKLKHIEFLTSPAARATLDRSTGAK